MDRLGYKIAKKRKDAGLTQTEFAEKLNVTRQSVSRWEAGTVLPDIDKISDIASILNVTCDYLLKDDIEEEDGTIPVSGVSRLLKDLEGKRVRFRFFDGETDMDLYDTPCLIKSFEGNWMKVEADTKKGTIEKLIPVSSVLSVEMEEE